MLTSLAPLTSLSPSGSEDTVHGGLTELILGIENEWACIKWAAKMHARLLASSRYCRGILNHCFWYTNDNLQESVSCARFEKFVALVASHTEENDTRVPFMEMVWTIQCLSSLLCWVNKIYAEQSEQESVTSLRSYKDAKSKYACQRTSIN